MPGSGRRKLTNEEFEKIVEKRKKVFEKNSLQKEPIMQGELTGYPSIDKPWLKYYSEEAKNTEVPKMTTYEYIFSKNKNNMDSIAIQYFGKDITYKELFQNIDKVSRALTVNGIKPGDTVTIALPNMPESVYLFYALGKIGAIANMIDPRSSESSINNYINEVKSDFVFALDSIYPKVKGVINNTTASNLVLISPSQSFPIPIKIAYNIKNIKSHINNKNISNSKVRDWKEFERDYKKCTYVETVKYVEDYPVAIEHTGGTTGMPKGVLLSNDALNMIAHHFIVSPLKFEKTQNWLDIMPPFIAYGIGNGLHLPLAVGMKVILIPSFDPSKFDDLISKYHPNNFAGTPVNWESIVNSKKFDGISFQNIVLPGVGGDSMNVELEKKANTFLQNHGASTKIVKGYGLTEVCAAACACFGEANKLGSVGIPFLHNNISIFEPGTEKELTYNQRGEICIYSPSTMLEYYGNEEETNKMLKKHSDGKIWVHTQDLGYMDEDGLLFVDGRIKRVIIAYDGFKIYPFPIEQLICSIPGVEDCKVLGVKDPNHIQGSVPVANIILSEDYKLLEKEKYEEIKKVCEEQLADYMIPYDYKFKDKFPRTNIGKVDFVSLENEEIEKQNVKKKTK